MIMSLRGSLREMKARRLEGPSSKKKSFWGGPLNRGVGAKGRIIAGGSATKKITEI